MKKISLLLAVVVAFSVGCSEDEEIKNVPVQKATKVQTTPKIKTIDELFTVAKKRYKDYGYKGNRLTFFSEELKHYKNKEITYKVKSKFITIESNPIKGISLYFMKNNDYKTVSSHGIKNDWNYNCNSKKLYTSSKSQKISFPNIITNNKYDEFKNYFKNLELKKEFEIINNIQCYKIIATLKEKNIIASENKIKLYFDTKNYNLIRIDEYGIVNENKAKIIQTNTFEEKNGKTSLSKVHMELKLVDIPEYTAKRTAIVDKIVYEVPFDEALLKCPKDENDYEKLQDYFNMLLKKYYDNKYQIKIK